jgi:hypothetical protein
MRMGKAEAARTGLGAGRPVQGAGALSDVGDLPGGGILAQIGNSCGTCCLSAILGHFGMRSTQLEIDRDIRNANLFTAPDLLVGYARARGLEAVFRNHGSVGEITGLIDRGIPCVLLLDPDFRKPLLERRLHYVAAISHRGEGEDFRLGVYNPWGLREEITGDELAGMWKGVQVGPLVCWNAAYIAIGAAGTDLGPGRRSGARGINLLALSFANAVNGAVHLFRDRRFAGGLCELAAAGPEGIAGLGLFFAERLGAPPAGRDVG